MNNTPFIHLLKTPYNFYFYDVNTGRIYKIEENIYSALELLTNGQENLLEEKELTVINKMRHDGLLKTNRPSKIENPLIHKIQYYLDKKVEGIALQVTQDCNFRCNYCPFSQDEDAVTRKHAKKNMSFTTAKKGIDFVQKHSSDIERLHIAFYGGEPLLEISLIKKIVAYAKKVFFGKHVLFTMTTNASLLNKDIIKFLSENNFSIVISLDGPKEIHDGNRRFAVNGCGTFDIIMKKLKILESYAPQYIKQNVIFNAVLDPSNEFDCINNIFMNYSILKDAPIALANVIDDDHNNSKNVYSSQFIDQKQYDHFKLLSSEVGWVKIEKLSKITINILASIRGFDTTLKHCSLQDVMTHGGPCRIGATKLFMDVDGRFFPCEKANEASNVMNIGSIDDGFDIPKIKNLLNICHLTEKQCKDCWAINLCCICPNQIDDGYNLSLEKKQIACRESKFNVEQKMREYLAIREIRVGGEM